MTSDQQQHPNLSGDDNEDDDDNVVDLIVGGYPYRTTRTVLLSSPFATETYFHALLSGRWKRTNQPIEIGDQDGRLFFFVLYFLQVGQLPRDVHCPSKRSLLSMEDIAGLEYQADFFGLSGLVKLCRAIQETVPEFTNNASEDDLVVWDGKRLGTDEYLLKKCNGLGYITKLTKSGTVPKKFSSWNGNSYYARNEPSNLTTYKLTEKYRSGWKTEGFFGSEYRRYGILRHPLGFKIEIDYKELNKIILNSFTENGQIEGKWKWVGGGCVGANGISTGSLCLL